MYKIIPSSFSCRTLLDSKSETNILDLELPWLHKTPYSGHSTDQKLKEIHVDQKGLDQKG